MSDSDAPPQSNAPEPSGDFDDEAFMRQVTKPKLKQLRENVSCWVGLISLLVLGAVVVWGVEALPKSFTDWLPKYAVRLLLLGCAVTAGWVWRLFRQGVGPKDGR